MSNAPATTQVRSMEIDGAIYEIVSNYIGSIPLLELLKLMLKRDLEKSENNTKGARK